MNLSITIPKAAKPAHDIAAACGPPRIPIIAPVLQPAMTAFVESWHPRIFSNVHSFAVYKAPRTAKVLALVLEARYISLPVRRKASLVEISVLTKSPALVRSGFAAAVVVLEIVPGAVGSGGGAVIGIVLALILDVNKPHAIPIPPPITPFTAVLNTQCSLNGVANECGNFPASGNRPNANGSRSANAAANPIGFSEDSVVVVVVAVTAFMFYVQGCAMERIYIINSTSDVGEMRKGKWGMMNRIHATH